MKKPTLIVNIINTKLIPQVRKELIFYNLSSDVSIFSNKNLKRFIRFEDEKSITKDYIIREIFHQLGLSNPF